MKKKIKVPAHRRMPGGVLKALTDEELCCEELQQHHTNESKRGEVHI